MITTEPIIWGEWIRAAREQVFRYRADLMMTLHYRKINVSEGQIKNWETNLIHPDRDLFDEMNWTLCDILDLDPVLSEEIYEHSIKYVRDSGHRKYSVEIRQRIGFSVVFDTDSEERVSGRPTQPAARLMCDCGNEYIATLYDLHTGHVQSCGHAQITWAQEYARRKTTKAEAEHRERAQRDGVTLIGKWQGAHTPMAIICPVGHVRIHGPKPNAIQSGQGWCEECVRDEPEVCEAKHRERARIAGVKLIGEWHGMTEPMDAICHLGHPCSPRPAAIQQGQGWCKKCGSIKLMIKVLKKNRAQGKFSGVYRDKRRKINPWCVRQSIDGKIYIIYGFQTAEPGARARDDLLREYEYPESIMNFPRDL